MADINVTEDIININVTEEVITIEAPTGGYPTPSTVYSVFGRTGAVVAAEGDYTLTQLGDVTIATPSNGQVLRYNGTAWVNATESFAGTVTSVNMSVPTGLTISGNPITTSGTLAVGLGAGYVIPTQAALDAKQDDLNGTGIVKSTAGTITYLSDNTANWNTAYNDSIVSASVTGTATKTLTLNQQDGGSVTASWTDTDTGLTSVGLSMPSAFSVANSPLTANGTLSVTGAGTTAQYVRGDGSLATFPSLTGYVPYTGATSDLNLGSKNLLANNAFLGFSSITASATQVVLTINSVPTYIVNGSGGQTIKLPDATTLPNGANYVFNNNQSSGALLVNNNSNTLVVSVPSGGYCSLELIDNSIAAGSWDRHFEAPSNVSWSTNTLDYAGSITSATWNGNVIQPNRGGTGQSTYTDGQLLIGNSTGNTLSKANLSAGTGISITNGAGSITIASTLTNPVTGTGTTNTLPKFTGASTIGNSNITDSGTLISFGLDTNINGLTSGFVTKVLPAGNTFGGLANGAIGNFTGSANGWNIINRQTWNINDDAFTFNGHTANDTRIVVNRSATSANGYGIYGAIFTNNGSASQGASLISASTGNSSTGNFSTVIIYRAGPNGPYTNINSYTSYYAFRAEFNPQNITNYYGISINDVTPITLARGIELNLTAGTNKWNIYAGGTAANHLAGDTAIGTTTLGTATQLTVGGTETAVSAIGRGQLINTTLVASANNDFLVGLEISPTFTIGSFTGVTNTALRLGGNLAFNNQNFTIQSSNNVTRISYNGGVGLTFSTADSTTPIRFVVNSFNESLRIFAATGNLLLQNGGTFTDAGFRLDVNGTTRFIGTASSDTAPLGSELAAVTGTGTNWTLAGTNLNVGGYTHTVGSVVPLTTDLAAVNGTYYQIAYTITGRTTGSITIDYGGTSTSGLIATGASGPLASSTAVLTITPTTDFNGTVVLSIKTIGTSVASSTFSTSASTSNIEVRASSASNNTFIGLQTGRRNTTGGSNTFVGSQVGINNTTGGLNTFLGSLTGQNNTIGNFNTFIGSGSGQANVSGGDNTFVGTSSGLNNTGSLNTFLGTNTGRENTTGGNNTFLGRAAGQSNTTGSGNVMIGQAAGRFITGGSTSNTISNNSIFIGDSVRAAADNQTNQIVIGGGTTGLGSNTTIIGTTATTTTALYGDLLLGTTTPSTATMLTVSGTETASSAIARGGLINTTLVASANNDNLIGLDIAPTFTNGGFTGVNNFGLRVSNITSVGNLAIGLLDNFLFTIKNFTSPRTITINPQSNLISASDGLSLNHNSIFTIRNNNVTQFHMFANGNIILQNGGTFTDAGFRLDVQGTARFTGTIFANSYQSGNSEGLKIFNDFAFINFTNSANNTRNAFIQATSTQLNLVAERASSAISFHSGGIVERMRLFQSGNLTIQNAGTFTDIPSANLAVNSTTQGFLPPRMTTTEKNAISSPATGLIVFDTTLGKLCVFATTWQTITST